MTLTVKTMQLVDTREKQKDKNKDKKSVEKRSCQNKLDEFFVADERRLVIRICIDTETNIKWKHAH